MNVMKKRSTTLSFIILITVLAIILLCVRSVSLEKKICKHLDNASSFDIICIEEMCPDQNPMVIDVNDQTDKQLVVDAVKNTAIRFKKVEVGLEFDSALYTVTVSSGDDQISITVTQNNDIHFNDNECTYVMTSDGELYQTLRDVFTRNQ